ncbi:MAG: cytochrome c [Rhodocyclaceae bacterium]|jgi:sulfide dehydrogenase [flavocytochrome c] flavoprotein subunit|uniref:NADPH-dependent 2,4-dienoyl-CoA reductase, sulfur reductase n=1 Tax=Candidatus Desulfobacillus denitrificans TaxID=2608985 RepID=A0A809R0E9_9PROT|nr:NADPH-dependent 2,4-dienoyl-CoA reductase, sulfur reductase [Candidatus Desulfobacillus denitrificans]GIK44680.1 MAG: cytochrome c [Betaproteobacteria bacterium]GJQ54923.1 MAG: cytochrome c [Rhodocyclaceae bacterium]
MTMERRSFLKLIGAGAGLGAASVMTGCAGLGMEGPTGGRRVVVVGGGYGGTIAAKYIRMMDKSIEVVLIERNDHFVSCPFSNLYLGGLLKDLSSLTINYDKLAANHGIKFVQAEVTGVDAAAKLVRTSRGDIRYDKLVLSPGIDFRTEEIKGYNLASTPDVMPHAWKAGPQTVLLRKQLEAMPAGGTVVMSIPLAPFRCPPGPYERASMIAMFLKQHKPKSKIVVLDANPDIVSKKGLFLKGWKKHYEGIIDYRPAKKVTEIDAAKKTVLIEGLEDVRGDVVNLIPPQRAGAIAVAAGVVGPDKNWCPINPTTFESTVKKDIHVIGDACIAGAMPKSGYSANSEAKTCATNIVNAMNGRELVDMSGINTCFSYLSAKEAVSVTGVYLVDKAKSAIVAAPGSVAVSPDLSELEAIYAESWLKNILTEMSS